MNTVNVQPHHPDCHARTEDEVDPETCCYCAALCRGEPEPLDFRYGGPACWCKPSGLTNENRNQPAW